MADYSLDPQQVPFKTVFSLACPPSNHFSPALSPKTRLILVLFSQKKSKNQKNRSI
jgi:hypothetical protein